MKTIQQQCVNWCATGVKPPGVMDSTVANAAITRNKKSLMDKIGGFFGGVGKVFVAIGKFVGKVGKAIGRIAGKVGRAVGRAFRRIGGSIRRFFRRRW